LPTLDAIEEVTMSRSIRLTLLVLLVTAPAAAHTHEAVLEWNQIALNATVTAAQGAVPQIRSMAIVQVSVHDAVNLISREYRTYLDARHTFRGASPDAAAIAAAHAALVGLFPAQAASLDAARAASLSARGLSEHDPGIAVGQAAAAAILSLRANDGAATAQFAYTAPDAGEPGVWVAIGTTPALLPGWGEVAPWVLRSGSPFQLSGPPALRSRRWARDFNEVKEIGSAASATRTAEQTEIARFWLASPSVIWNGVTRQIVQKRRLDGSSAARVFALLYLAAADASIVCWDAKYAFNFWRPQAAIRQGDADGNDATAADPAWSPLFPTPPHPDYLSGHTTNSSAMATVLRRIFGDAAADGVVATSTSNPGFERRWETLSEGVEEVIDARIYSGIHYRTSDEVGAQVGRAVARIVMERTLRPRGGHR
jgi:hypothetical protein